MKYGVPSSTVPQWKEAVSPPFAITKAKLQQIENRIRLDFKLLGTERTYTVSNTPEFGALFEFYKQTTNEKAVQLCTYQNGIFPQLTNRKQLVCIGPGDGPYIENFLAKSEFQNALLVERDGATAQNLENRLKDSKLIQNTKFEIRAETFPDCTLKEADLITMDHVHYFFDPADWVKFSKLAYDATKKDGILSITVHGDRQYPHANNEVATIIEYFSGANDNITRFAYDLRDALGGDADMATFCARTDHMSATYEAMRYIMNFFMLDSGAQVDEPSFRSYIEKHVYNEERSIYHVLKADRYITAKRK
ncbi:MAG: hypothetical protein V1728_00300 [Candidatus Micrarchaeota archaeon]